ncbi:MAG: DoxX family protein [Bdellovibrionota bacterium]
MSALRPRLVFLQAPRLESVVRLLLVIALLVHGPWNFLESGAIWWAAATRFPIELRWFVGAFEIIAAFCLIVGIGVRLISLGLVVIFFAAITQHWSNGFSFQDGGWEIPFVYLVLSILLAWDQRRL